MRHFCLTLALTMGFLLVTTAQTEEKPFAPYTFTSVQSGTQNMKNNVSVKKFAARKCSIAPTHKYKKNILLISEKTEHSTSSGSNVLHGRFQRVDSGVSTC